MTDDAHTRTAIRFNTIDSTIVLSIAFLINAGILVQAVMVFYGQESVTVAGGEVVQFGEGADWIHVAYLTLAPLLGTTAASVLFAVALLASGQSSTITGTLAGQVVMEGFMHWRLAPWTRRAITRGLAILPAVLIIGIRGDSSVNDLLTLSQVILALQLTFAMFPLLHFTSSSRWMGKWKNGWFLLTTGWTSAILITAMACPIHYVVRGKSLWGLRPSTLAATSGLAFDFVSCASCVGWTPADNATNPKGTARPREDTCTRQFS